MRKNGKIIFLPFLFIGKHFIEQMGVWLQYRKRYVKYNIPGHSYLVHTDMKEADFASQEDLHEVQGEKGALCVTWQMHIYLLLHWL